MRDEYIVRWNDITHKQLATFKQTLEAAPNEAAMQTFLEQNPQILIQHIAGGYDRWVIPKKRLGAEHETDFLIAEKDAVGYTWYAVELERPQAKLFTSHGDPSAALTHALRQISDWRSWLSHNRDYSTRAPEQAGLGLTDIDPELEGLLIIGRETDVDKRTAERRRRLAREHRIKINTYDWLGEQAKAHLAALDQRASDDPRVAFITEILNQPPEPAKRALETVFGSPGNASADLSATRSLDWDFVTLEAASGTETDVVVEIIRSYSPFEQKLSRHDWEDWVSRVREDIQESYSLLITSRRPDEAVNALMVPEADGVWFQTHEADWSMASGMDVLVYLESPDIVEDCVNRISIARQVILRYLPTARESRWSEVKARLAEKKLHEK